MDIYGIILPRDFQLKAINHSVFKNDSYIFVIQPMASEKSLIPLTVATIRHRVAIMLVPLIGLGCNKVEDTLVIKNNADAYHIDEHKYRDTKKLCNCLSDFLVKFWSGQHIFTSTARIRILMDTQYTLTH